MKLFIGITIALIVAVGSSLVFTSMSIDSSPEQVVHRYCELSERGEFNAIKTLTTDTPDEYRENYSRALDRLYGDKLYGNSDEDSSRYEGLSNSNLTKVVSPNHKRSSTIEYVDKSTPELIFREGQYVKEIVQVWINGNEARFRVNMGARKSEKYVMRTDFLLHKEGAEWKIFAVNPIFPSESWGSSNP